MVGGASRDFNLSAVCLPGNAGSEYEFRGFKVARSLKYSKF